MLISLCIPIMNRIEDLQSTLLSTIKSSRRSEQVEVVILDYNSRDGLEDYIKRSEFLFDDSVFLTYKRIEDKKFFSMSHSRNLSVINSIGDYVVTLSADTVLHEDFVHTIRKLIERERPDWLCEDEMSDVIVCKKHEFISSGGYDERFDCYGPEDKDMCQRLHRRGGKFIKFSKGLFSNIYTLNSKKLENYDLVKYKDKRDMSIEMHKIYDKNIADNVLVANMDLKWWKE